MNLKIILIFFLPIVIFFTILALKKNDLGSFFDKTKTNLIRDELQANTKIIIQKDHVSKTFTVLKNINAENAVSALIKLIQKHGDWQEPNNV